MEDSILVSVKRAVGVPDDYDIFDDTLIADINTAFAILYQIGFGSMAFQITGVTESWDDSPIGDNTAEVKTYIFNRVKLMFDPPASGTLVDLLERQCKEFECRVNYEVDKNRG